MKLIVCLIWGSFPDIEKIVKLLPFTRQTLFFSATMPPIIQKLVQDYLHNPERIEVASESTTASTITQKFKFVPTRTPAEKREILRNLLKSESVRNAIIFCNRKRDVGILQRSLEKHGFNAGALHGDMDQHARMDTLAAFKNDEIKLLCASDVAARGLDIPNVSHVFNFDIPRHSEDYVHRIGRTGRAGKKGSAISLITSADRDDLDAIIKLCKITDPDWIDEKPLPAGADHGGRNKNERGAPKGRGKGRNASAGNNNNSDQAKETSPETRTTPTPPKPEPQNTSKPDVEKTKEPTPDKTDNRKPARNARPDNNRKPGNDRGRRRQGKGTIVGMGDHVPAFMTKSVKTIR